MLARLRAGDRVVVISGRDKGKVGKIRVVAAGGAKVVVEGVNLKSRHVRPSPKVPQGGIVQKEAPLHACKVMPVDPATGRGTRVRTGTVDGRKVRLAKSGSVIEPTGG